MTSNKPPPRPSKQPPKRRETVEVQLEWLEEEAKTKGKRKPPPLPNARVQPPPMPVMPSKPPPVPRRSKAPPPRQTMEVDIRELVIVPKAPPLPIQRPRTAKPIPREDDEAPTTRHSKPPASRRSKPPTR